jgi:hypothetical protein
VLLALILARYRHQLYRLEIRGAIGILFEAFRKEFWFFELLEMYVLHFCTHSVLSLCVLIALRLLCCCVAVLQA